MSRRERRSPRWPTYDYRRPALYFVTVFTAGRREVFGEVAGREARLSLLGQVAHAEWVRTAEMRGGVALDAFVVMPNHVHLLFGIVDDGPDRDDGPNRDDGHDRRRDTMHGVPTDRDGSAVGDQRRRFGQHDAGSVSSVVGAYKAATTRNARRLGLWDAGPLWQGRFHDRVVRSAREAGIARRYIAENPARWAADRFHPARPHDA